MKILYNAALVVGILTSSFAYSGDEYTEKPAAAEVEAMVDALSADAHVLEVSFYFYRDRQKHDEQMWRSLFEQLACVAELYPDEITRNPEMFIDELTTSLNSMLKAVYGKALRAPQTGVNCEVRVGVTDGKCPQGCCGGNCECPKRYAGNCLCGLQENRENFERTVQDNDCCRCQED